VVKYRESNPCCGVEAGALTKSVHSVRIFMAVKVNNFQNVLYFFTISLNEQKFDMTVMLCTKAVKVFDKMVTKKNSLKIINLYVNPRESGLTRPWRHL
jgi:hypothetical protein